MWQLVCFNLEKCSKHGDRMNRTGPLELVVGDVVRLKKPHPCGSFEWTVTRLGADIGLRCHGCDRKVLLPRRTLEKRLKAFVERGPAFELANQLLELEIPNEPGP
jgi:hypothetical protein